jgi:hypothetical protein
MDPSVDTFLSPQAFRQVDLTQADQMYDDLPAPGPLVMWLTDKPVERLSAILTLFTDEQIHDLVSLFQQESTSRTNSTTAGLMCDTHRKLNELNMH